MRMLCLEGIAVSGGYAGGIAAVYDYETERKLELPRRAISHSEVEPGQRLDDSFEQSSQALKIVEQTASSEPRLADSGECCPPIRKSRTQLARWSSDTGRESVNVEDALDSVIRDFVECLQRLESPVFFASANAGS